MGKANAYVCLQVHEQGRSMTAVQQNGIYIKSWPTCEAWSCQRVAATVAQNGDHDDDDFSLLSQPG